MVIYSRYSAAFLILSLLTPKAFSAVRVPVIQNDEYIRQVLSRQTASTGAISTPAGQVAFFGADKVFAFSAGDSVRPTVREVTPWIKGQTATTGAVSFPYGPGAAYSTDPNLTPAAATKVKVKPQVVVPKTNILNALKDGLKTNPGQLALTATVAAAVAGVGWVMSPDNTGLQTKDTIPSTPSGNACYQYGDTCYASISAMCSRAMQDYPNSKSPTSQVIGGVGYCSFVQGSFGISVTRPPTYLPTCPAGSTISPTGSCTSDAFRPVTNNDLQYLDPWVNEQSAEWLGGLIRDVCNGSPNPGGCFTSLADRSKGMIQGPSFIPGPITSKTTTITNPDGTTSTKTETTKTDFKVTYGNNYFDVDTEKKTTVTQDGQTVSETTEKDDTPPDDIETPDPGEQQPEPEYTFNDSPFPEITPFYDQKYPDGLSGVWNQAKADIDNSSFMRFLSSFIPSFSGSCPTFGLNFAIGNMANFGSVDFQSLCYVFDFVKIILLVTAVFAARQLTFGG